MFSDSELSDLHQTQEDHMMDKCTISDAKTGETLESICGLEMLDYKQAEKFGAGGHYQVIEMDARLRLPSNVSVNPKDIIRVTHRFGKMLPKPFVYEVIRFSQEGSSGQRVYLKAKTR